MQIREDIKLNYGYLLIERIDEINEDFGFTDEATETNKGIDLTADIEEDFDVVEEKDQNLKNEDVDLDEDLNPKVTLGYVMLRTLTDMKIKSPIDKMDLIHITARDMYNTACKIYEEERAIKTKTTNRK